MNIKKNQSKTQIGSKFEDKTIKTIGSGNLWFQKGDIHYGDYCLECKYTNKKGFRITKDIIEKVWSQAFDCNKEPLLVIGIKRNDNEIFTLHCKINIERYK